MDWPAFLLGAAAVITAAGTPLAAVLVARARSRRIAAAERARGATERPRLSAAEAEPPPAVQYLREEVREAQEEINRLWDAHHRLTEDVAELRALAKLAAHDARETRRSRPGAE